MPTWPASVPFLFVVDGFTYEPISSTTPISTESGEPMTRRRFTGEMDSINGSLPLLTAEQVNDLREFYFNDLRHGSLRFTCDDPLINRAREFIFLSPPRFVPVGGGWWQPQLRLQAIG